MNAVFARTRGFSGRLEEELQNELEHPPSPEKRPTFGAAFGSGPRHQTKSLLLSVAPLKAPRKKSELSLLNGRGIFQNTIFAIQLIESDFLTVPYLTFRVGLKQPHDAADEVAVVKRVAPFEGLFVVAQDCGALCVAAPRVAVRRLAVRFCLQRDERSVLYQSEH